MYFLKRLLTWWNSQTISTQLYTWRNGQKVGEDEQGNIFYQTKDAKRRWVIYNGESERKSHWFISHGKSHIWKT
jgi:NADH:ubiquinone oxidoreductase subunit